MKFIELSGKALFRLVDPKDIPHSQLHEAGVEEDSLVRINRQGDIEIRRPDRWDVIGGLLGDFDHRLRHETGLDWA